MANERGELRLFLGIPITTTTTSVLARAAEAMRREAYDSGYQIRWVPPVNYHVTIKFLGWSPPAVVEVIRDCLAPDLGALPAFELTTSGLGAFPDPHNARVIWSGIEDPDDAMRNIASIVETRLAEVGFARDRKPFHPHVTLGRVKRVDDVSSLLAGPPERVFSKTVVNRVVLYESIMKSTGSEYSELEIFRLDQRRKPDKRHTEPLKTSPDSPAATEVTQPAGATSSGASVAPEPATEDTNNEPTP